MATRTWWPGAPLGAVAVVAAATVMPSGVRASDPQGGLGLRQQVDAEAVSGAREPPTQGGQPATAPTGLSEPQSLADSVGTATTAQIVALLRQLVERAQQGLAKAVTALDSARKQRDVVEITAAYTGMKACLNVIEQARAMSTALLAGGVELTDAVREQIKNMVEDLQEAERKVDGVLSEQTGWQDGSQELAALGSAGAGASSDASDDDVFFAEPLPVIARPREASRYLPP